MTRLLMFLAFWPASYVVYVNAEDDNIISIIGIYLGSFVTGYVLGKSADIGTQFVKGKRDVVDKNNRMGGE